MPCLLGVLPTQVFSGKLQISMAGLEAFVRGHRVNMGGVEGNGGKSICCPPPADYTIGLN